MKTTLITTAMLALLAGAGHAQTTIRTENSAAASASAGSSTIAGEAAMQQTVELGLPTAHVSSVIAEGRARGATVAQIDQAALAAHARLQASRDALRGDLRASPTDAEIEAGASALASGAEVSALADLRSAAPADRSLTASLHALASLTAQGLTSSAAATELAAMLTAGATDSQLSALSAIDANGAVNLPLTGADATLSGAAAAGLGGVTGTAEIGAGLGGEVTGATNVGAGLVGGVTGTVDAAAGVVDGL